MDPPIGSDHLGRFRVSSQNRIGTAKVRTTHAEDSRETKDSRINSLSTTAVQSSHWWSSWDCMTSCAVPGDRCTIRIYN